MKEYCLLKVIGDYNFIAAVKSHTFKCACYFLHASIRVLKCTEAKLEQKEEVRVL